MSLQKMQTSFKNESAESLDDFIARANDLRGQFATASMLDEDAFVLLFLAALSESSLAAWAQSLLAHKPLIYADVIENMRGMCSAEMLTKREAPGQQAYAVVHASSACAYCHKPGHNILQCFKLRIDQRTNDEGISINHHRGGGNTHCRVLMEAAVDGNAFVIRALVNAKFEALQDVMTWFVAVCACTASMYHGVSLLTGRSFALCKHFGTTHASHVLNDIGVCH